MGCELRFWTCLDLLWSGSRLIPPGSLDPIPEPASLRTSSANLPYYDQGSKTRSQVQSREAMPRW